MSDQPFAALARAESEFFRALNALVEPAVRAGCGSPGLVPTGLVLIETTGARTGQPRRVPLLATVFDGCVFISTVRGARSQWVKNLRACPDVRYWIGGREHCGQARLFAPGASAPDTRDFPVFARGVVDGLLVPATQFGWTFAVITPATAPAPG